MSKLSKNISALIEKNGYNTTTFSKKMNMPQTTLHKIVTGDSKVPNAATIKKIADFFNVSVESLKNNCGYSNNNKIPLLQWVDIQNWINESNTALETPYITIGRDVSDKSFAIKSSQSLIPQYKDNSFLIFEPNLTAKEGSYSLIKLHKQHTIILRQLVFDVDQKYVKPLNPDLSKQLTPLSAKDEIIACLIQVVVNYEEN